MDGQWRQEIPEDMRKQMITEMYHELARISGEVDKQKVWGSAAKFELMLWSNSPDKNTYLVKMQRKIMSLKKKMGAGDNTAQQQQPQAIAQPNMIATNPGAINTAAMNAAAMNAATSMNAAAATSNPMVVNAANMAAAAGLNPQQFQANVNANQAVNMMNNFQQANNVMGTANGTTPVTAAAVNPSVTVGMSASNAVGNTVNTSAATTAVNIAAPPHQQAQQWLQRIQVQFQAQQQQLLHTQNQEIQQLRQQHLNQQQQLAQQQQQGGVSPDLRRQQLQNLQQQHQLARTRLQQLHKGKQQQLQRKQQQYLLQKQQQLQQQQQQAQLNNAATTVTSTMMGNTQVGTSSAAMNLPNATTIQTPVPSVVSAANATSQAQAAMAARNVKPEQLSAAHNQQAAMRELQRQQNTAELEQNGLKHGNNGMPTTPTGGAAAAAADDGNSGPYVERLKELRRKYWDDLVIVFREFERMVKQKPASQQQERINTFLINLKRIIALLQQDPTKATNTRNDLDRVEAHIQKQVLPILERLKNKTRAAAGVSAANAAQQQQQQEQLKKQQLEQQRLAQLQEQQKKMQEQQKAEQQRKLMEEQKKKQLEAATAAAKKQQEMLEQQRKQQQQRAQQQAFLQQQRQKVLAQQQQQLAAAQLNKVQQNQLRANAAAGAVVATAQQPAVAGGADANNLAAQTSGVNGATAVTPPVVGVTPAVSSATVASPNSANGNAALTPAQYRTFKLPDAQKQRLTAQHAKLREQQQELIMQQSRAKTPAQQAKLAQQAQRLAHMINKISQQLVQCKLAEEYEQTQGKPLSMGTPTSVSQPTMSQASVATMALNKSKPMKVEDLPGGAVTTPTSVNVIANGIASAVAGSALAAANALAANGAMAVPAAVADAPLAVAGLADVSKPADISAATDPAFKSVVPDLTGLGASEKLLTAVAAYEKHKPEVLKRGSSRFSRIAVTIGAKLNTSYVAT